MKKLQTIENESEVPVLVCNRFAWIWLPMATERVAQVSVVSQTLSMLLLSSFWCIDSNSADGF